MRRIVLLSLFVLLVGDAGAQRRGGFAPALGRGGVALSSGRGGLRPALGRRGSGFGRGRMEYPGGYGYGYGYGDLPYSDSESFVDSPPPVFLVQPPPPPPVVEPPPREAHPVTTNYTWPGSASSAPPESAPQTFGIVLKDGSTLSATTVMAADDVLHYVDPDERHMRISMRDVDRGATMKLNRERKLNLYLPAAPQ